MQDHVTIFTNHKCTKQVIVVLRIECEPWTTAYWNVSLGITTQDTYIKHINRRFNLE